MHALSSALSKSATKCEPTTAKLEDSVCTCTYTIEEKTSEVGEFLNHKMHNLASTMIQNGKREPFDYQSLDIDKQMELVDPALTQNIQTITKPYNEMRQQGTADEHSLSTHTKKMCRFYCFCVRLHVLLMDTVMYYRGSSELIRVLIRIGAVALEDTHTRLVTYVSGKRGR